MAKKVKDNKRKLKHKGYDYYEDQLEQIKRIAEETGVTQADVVKNIMDKALDIPTAAQELSIPIGPGELISVTWYPTEPINYSPNTTKVNGYGRNKRFSGAGIFDDSSKLLKIINVKEKK